jgi:hypothetical protein
MKRAQRDAVNERLAWARVLRFAFDVSAAEDRAARARATLYETEAIAAELRRELAPADAPLIGERTHRALDFISAWVCEARALHSLAERELSIFRERRRCR